MGQKTHPYGFRLGYNKGWKSRWFAKKDYADLLHEDVELRKQLKERLKSAGVDSIDIERAANKLVVRIYTARPGIIIGRKGSEIDKLKSEVQKRTKREVHIDIQEVHRPELDAQLVAESIALQLEKRVAFRRAMRKAVDSALRFGCKGIKVRVGGRLNGAEIARKEWYLQGRLPLQTLRADIDFGTAEAHTTYGVIGVKCWIYQGEKIPQRGKPGAPAPKRRKRNRRTIMLMPKKVKYRKQQRGRRTGKAWRGGSLAFGEYGLKALEPAWITDRQIEAARVAITRFIKRGGKLWIRSVSGQAVHEEAGRDAHGQGQRATGALGGGREAGAHHVRNVGRGPGVGHRGHGAGGAQAADHRRSL